MKIPGWTVAAVVAAGVGFVAGRASGGVDDQQLRLELEAWKRDATLATAQRDSSRAVISGIRRYVASVNAEAELWRGRALAAERKGNQHQRNADSLLALLAIAATPRDSNAILANACTERGLECAAIREANAGLKQAAERDRLAKDGQAKEIAEHVTQRERDSSDLIRAGSLVRTLEKAVRGCRWKIPLLLTIPCLEPLGGYNLSDQAFEVGGLVPVKLGPLGRINVSITTKVGGLP